ncbi:hypothetical protein MPSEU_000135300 [Mayamaea pseudoterrestris]|nr:hypothetical protein MPSEU_000135300 [Mayamaea pseudoterrestris]
MSNAAQDPDTKLLVILGTEIARDGGASLTTLIKEHYVERPKLIDSLLQQTVGSKQLLKFFERHASVFQVDRSTSAHYVKLLKNDWVDADLLNETIANDARRIKRQDNVKAKVVYALQKRNALLARRQRPGDTLTVTCEWLLKQCMIPMHLYLRAIGFYRRTYSSYVEVKAIGSLEWEEMALPAFKSLLDGWVFFNDDGKILLACNDTVSDSDYEQIACKLQEAVDKDGATQVSMSLLLHREPSLRNLLGGRDLMQLIEKFPEGFQHVKVTSDDRHEVYLQSTKPRVGRMDVDETGLFSVASARWSTAMANILASQCRLALGSDAMDTVAVDLTASVGGITIGLAKAFAKVIAIEIDAHRAGLCRTNMLKHGVDKSVEVRNVDAMEEIVNLPSNAVVVIDPPWGGHNYKREGYLLQMGPWSFEDVLEKLGRTLAPCVCGMRLPVMFRTEELYATLTTKKLPFKVLRSKRMGPQLFLCIHFYII